MMRLYWPTLLLSILPHTSNSEAGICHVQSTPPMVAPQTLVNGKWTVGEALPSDMEVQDVFGCCIPVDEQSCGMKPAVIGKMPQFTTTDTLDVLENAKTAWNGGMGDWPKMGLKNRINAIETLLEELMHKRSEIVEILMWEIGKNQPDAESEFDRTISFARQLIQVIQTHPEFGAAKWTSLGSTRTFIKRAAVGIILCLGPYNYPLNETYATLLPALLMGNVVILKIPTVGGLVHLLTMEAFQKALPPGVINFVAGRGRSTMPPMMQSGVIDGLAFIGGSNAADSLIKDHPRPHRLKVFLQLEAKNMAIYLEDLFTQENRKALDNAIKETVLGSLSFNGQRCTALKQIFVPREHSAIVASMIVQEVEAIRVGLPWQTFEGDKYSQITPLPDQSRVTYMQQLIEDALLKGAKIMNTNGGEIIGGAQSTLMVPAVLYPVTPEMRVYHEEQFGPVVPIAEYDTLDQILAYAREGKYAQQCSIFTAGGSNYDAQRALDSLVNIFGKVNINSQCGRSPDTVPFSGRRSSAMGVMSVLDALKEFSIPTVVSYKDSDDSLSQKIVEDLEQTSQFLQPVL